MSIDKKAIKNNICVLLWFRILQITTFIFTPYSKDLLFSCIKNKSYIFTIVLTELVLSLLIWASYVILFNVFFTGMLMTGYHLKRIIIVYVCNQLVFKSVMLLAYNTVDNYYALFWIIDVLSVVCIQLCLITVFRDLMPVLSYKKPIVYILITAAAALAVIGAIILLSDNISAENSRTFERYILIMVIMIVFQFLLFVLIQHLFPVKMLGRMILLTIIWFFFALFCCGIKTIFPFGMISNRKVHQEYSEKINEDEFYIDETTTRIFRSYGQKSKEVYFCQELEIYYGKEKIYTLKEYNSIDRKDIVIKDDNKTLEIKNKLKVTADENGKCDCVEL